jgi:HEAT repeat protein
MRTAWPMRPWASSGGSSHRLSRDLGATEITPSIDRKAVMDSLVERLGDRDALVRGAAINALASNPGQSGDPHKALAVGLEDESAENRVAAINGLLFIRQGIDPWRRCRRGVCMTGC